MPDARVAATSYLPSYVWKPYTELLSSVPAIKLIQILLNQIESARVQQLQLREQLFPYFEETPGCLPAHPQYSSGRFGALFWLVYRISNNKKGQPAEWFYKGMKWGLTTTIQGWEMMFPFCQSFSVLDVFRKVCKSHLVY